MYVIFCTTDLTPKQACFNNKRFVVPLFTQGDLAQITLVRTIELACNNRLGIFKGKYYMTGRLLYK
jgi:hypothetical protein